MTVDQAIDYVHWLSDEHFRDQEMSKSTLRTYLAALSRFYAYLIRERLAPIPAGEHERLKDAYRDFRRGGYRRLPEAGRHRAAADAPCFAAHVCDAGAGGDGGSGGGAGFAGACVAGDDAGVSRVSLRRLRQAHREIFGYAGRGEEGE